MISFAIFFQKEAARLWNLQWTYRARGELAKARDAQRATAIHADTAMRNLTCLLAMGEPK